MRSSIASANGMRKRLAAAFVVAMSTNGLVCAAWSKEPVNTRFGAWELHCETPADAKSEQCVLTQTVNAEDKPNVNLGVMILKPRDAKTGILRIVAPLSVFLLNGVSLKIDQADIGRTAFFRCFPTSCLADAPIDDKLVEQLENGKIATLVIYLTPFEGIRHQAKLEGFKEGYAKLR